MEFLGGVLDVVKGFRARSALRGRHGPARSAGSAGVALWWFRFLAHQRPEPRDLGRIVYRLYRKRTPKYPQVMFVGFEIHSTADTFMK